jgi:alpha-tubulin suppressor-like RCC1 family protein
MFLHVLSPLRRGLLPLALLAIAAACDDHPASPDAQPADASLDRAATIETLTCTVTVRTGEIVCASEGQEDPGEVGTEVVLNPAGKFVSFNTSNTSYVGETYTFDATVTNLIKQTLGVSRNGQYDGNGIRVFFTQLPVATSGTGTITVNGAETGKVTQAGQTFYRYPQTLAPNATSQPLQWNFTVPATVTTFTFSVLVAASVQYPHGWVEITTGGILRVPRSAVKTLSAVVRDYRGRDITASAGPIVWTVADPSVATTAGSTLTAAAVSGFSTLTATNGNRLGEAQLIVGEPFTQLTGGGGHTCGLTASGRAWCWGANGSGQLGNNSTADRLTPVDVHIQQGGINLVQIAAGANHTCALSSTGQVWCWGLNSSGQLGNNSTTNRRTPVAVQQGALSFVRIAAGAFHTCVRTATGATYCWGANNKGQVGDNTTTNRLTPTAVQGSIPSDNLALGREHSCGATSDTWCWGDNSSGQLGNNSTVQSNVPVRVKQGTLGHVKIVAGAYFTCRLFRGQPWCWGANESGQLGNGTTSARYTPVSVALFDIAQISAGYAHACGRGYSSSQSYCWGDNTFGQLGDNTVVDRLTPVVVQQGATSYVEIATGSYHSCGRVATGRAFCWGLNSTGQVGDNSTTQRNTPVAVQGAP